MVHSRLMRHLELADGSQLGKHRLESCQHLCQDEEFNYVLKSENPANIIVRGLIYQDTLLRGLLKWTHITDVRISHTLNLNGQGCERYNLNSTT
jgi:hypothetical protein